MNKLKVLLIGLAAGLVALAAVACSGAAAKPTPTSNASGNGNTVATGNPLPAEIAAVLSNPERFASAMASVAALGSSASQVSGIWVTGTGERSLKPDLAIVSLGVQADAKTVAEARDQAANAMTAVVEALKKLGIAEKDIQIAYFSIQPQYTYRQVTRCPDAAPAPMTPDSKPMPSSAGCYQESEQVLVGYQVTNTVTVKVRNLDVVGQVVDAAALAGGDVARVNNVSFTVEDSKAAQAAAREEAVKDALAKARQFAQLTGVKLGKLLYITESGGVVAPTPAYRAEAFAGADSKTTTPISAGELDVSVSVQAVFAIE